MNIHEAIKERHSVRTYTDKALTDSDLDFLVEAIAYANYRGNLNIMLRVDEPAAFVGGLANYGNIKGARNFLAMIGPKGKTLDERLGYYGERIVLEAKMRGIDAVWLGLSYNKSHMRPFVGKGEACPIVIAMGYGADSGKPHKVKEIERLCLVSGKPVEHTGDLPRWFTAGLEAAQLAPTALNQQKFAFDLVEGPEGHAVRPITKRGPYTRIDLGIAKCHFEIGAKAYSDDWMWV